MFICPINLKILAMPQKRCWIPRLLLLQPDAEAERCRIRLPLLSGTDSSAGAR